MNIASLAPTAAAPAAGVIASLALATLLPSLAVSSANVALPVLSAAFAADTANLPWAVLAYLLATTTLIVGAGRLGDRVGRRRVLLGGIGLFTTASALCALAPSLPWLVAARALQGVGAAAMLALTLAFVGAALPKARTGAAMGLLGTMSAVGTAIGPSVGGVLITAFGWPALFALNLPLGLLAFLMAWRWLPADRPGTESAGFDLAGLLVLGVTLGAFSLAMTRSPAWLLAAALGALLFVRIEARAAAPLVPLQRLRDPALARALAMNLLVSAVLMATLVIGPFHLGGTLGLGIAAVGALMSVGPALSALSGVPAGRLVDRFGTRRMARLGLVAVVLGCALIGLLPGALGAIGYVGPLVLVTPGYALFQAANNTAVMGEVAAEERGLIGSVLTLSRNLGLITGASAMTAVYLTAGLGWSFALATAFAALAFALAKRAQ